jgi:hypothetical protein
VELYRGQIASSWAYGRWYRSVSSADPCLYDKCRTLRALELAVASLAVWRQLLHPTTTARRIATSQQLLFSTTLPSATRTPATEKRQSSPRIES